MTSNPISIFRPLTTTTAVSDNHRRRLLRPTNSVFKTSEPKEFVVCDVHSRNNYIYIIYTRIIYILYVYCKRCGQYVFSYPDRIRSYSSVKSSGKIILSEPKRLNLLISPVGIYLINYIKNLIIIILSINVL